MRAHPWTENVHATMLALGLTMTRAQILGRFGSPEGKQTSDDRISVAMSRGWFTVSRIDGEYLYTAAPRSRKSTKWTPEKDALLATYWPVEGIKCLKRFPGASRGAVLTRLEGLNEGRPQDQKIRRLRNKPAVQRIKRVEEEPRNSGKSRDGLPQVASIFHLAQALEAA